MLSRLRAGLLGLAVALCAGACGSRADDLLRPDPALPILASVEAMGLRATAGMQPAGAGMGDPFLRTQQLVELYRGGPVETMGTTPVFALAHQWGRVQILLDHLRRYDALLARPGDPDWDGDLYRALRALRSASFGVDDDAPDKYARLAAALPSARFFRSTHPSTLLTGLYTARGDVSASREQVAEARRQLRIRSLQLEDYARRLLARWQPQLLRQSPEAVRILESHASE